MSAFLVGAATLHKILTEIARQAGEHPEFRELCETELLVDFSRANWQERLGQKMLELNQLSLGYRYGDGEEQLSYRFSPFFVSPVAAFKALQCWLYQCCEGEIPEQSRLYRFFVKVKAIWCKHIVESLPEYEEAEWG